MNQGGQEVLIEKYEVPIIKVDEEKRIVKGVVYKPYVKDAHGDWMTPEDIEKTAHNFLGNLKTRNVDTNHSLVKVNAYVCESYIAKANDPEGYPDGAWVVAVKVESDELWNAILRKEYEAFSMWGRGKAILETEPPETS